MFHCGNTCSQSKGLDTTNDVIAFYTSLARDEEQHTFDKLKQHFTAGLVLAMYNPECQTHIEVDTSKFTMGQSCHRLAMMASGTW